MRRICGRSPQRLAGTPIFHRFSKDNFQHESASLFFTQSLDLWLRMRWKWRCIVYYTLFLRNREQRKSLILSFFIFKRFSRFRINILKCTSLREIYSKLSTSRQILEFNRLLQIIERFRDFLVPIYNFETPREKEGRERKALFGKIISCNGALCNWTNTDRPILLKLCCLATRDQIKRHPAAG